MRRVAARFGHTDSPGVLLMVGGKYATLHRFLVTAAGRGQSAVRMSFAEVAELVGGLPTSAYRRRQWWGNGYLVQAKSWRCAGWRVAGLDLPGEWVSFVRETEQPARDLLPT